MIPSRADSSCVIGSKPAGNVTRRQLPSPCSKTRSPSPSTDSPAPSRTSVVQPAGRKSQAVLSDGWGMPGVSGDENVQQPSGPGAIRDGFAKLPGDVPRARDDGFCPSGGSVYPVAESVLVWSIISGSFPRESSIWQSRSGRRRRAERAQSRSPAATVDANGWGLKFNDTVKHAPFPPLDASSASAATLDCHLRRATIRPAVLFMWPHTNAV